MDTNFGIRIRIYMADADGYPQASLCYRVHAQVWFLYYLVINSLLGTYYIWDTISGIHIHSWDACTFHGTYNSGGTQLLPLGRINAHGSYLKVQPKIFYVLNIEKSKGEYIKSLAIPPHFIKYCFKI